ncbi:hypothetical protein HYT02_01135 [Candidatus Gottesmanbacteria bacterium]|nr:hypothetical protein [Candidatus Gottesmanbacteria bacterium]
MINNPVAPTYTIGPLISGLIGFFIFFASIAAFLYFIIGGIQWITSGGDKAQIETARNRIIQGVVGLIIIASVWAIVTLLFPAVGLSFPNITFPGIGQGLPG